MDAELRFHIEAYAQDLIRSGVPHEEAQRRARVEFGGVERAKEECRDARGANIVESVIQDLGFGLRMLRKNPTFTAIAVLTLALGIGANTALFSVVNGVLLNPLPYAQPDQLVSLAQTLPPFPQFSISYPNFLDWTRMNRTFQAMAAYRPSEFNLTGSDEAQRVKAVMVSASFFPVLGITPALGRNFSPAEDRPDGTPVAILSAGFWKSKFAGSWEVVGKTLTLDGQEYTVIGVLPEAFYFCCENTNFRLGDVYVPVGAWNVPWVRDRGAHPGLYAVGRLKDGVTAEQARQDMSEIARNLAEAYPDANKNAGIALTPLKEQMVGDVRLMLLMLLWAVGFVLLIACANIANLLSARSVGRTREFAIRAALGASRGRVTRQLLVESVLLGLAGGALGLSVAVWATKAGLAALPQALPLAGTVRVDQRVLLFTLVVSVFSGVLFGLIPIWQISRTDAHETLKEAKRATSAHHRTQSLFVVSEMALAMVLLIGAGLTIRSLANLWSVHAGFNPQNVWKFGVAWPASTQKETPDQLRADLNRLTDTIAAVPGVAALAITDGAFPMAGDNEVGFWIEGQPKPATTSEMANAMNYIVGPDYLKTLGIPLLEGRFLSREDGIHSSWVAVIDEQFKRQYFPTQDPLGRHINLAGIEQPFEIVGVVGHVIQFGLDENEQSPVRSQIYTAVEQIPDEYVSLLAKSNGFVARTETPSYASVSAIRDAVQGQNSQQIAYGFESMKGIITDSLAARRFTMTLLAIFAGLAVLLASGGIYGVFSHVVSQRTYEIGIRMALGAERKTILMMVLRQAGGMTLTGLAIGLLASLGLTRLMASMLFRVDSYDPVTLLCVALILSLVALTACYVPARRAARVDPMVALRCE